MVLAWIAVGGGAGAVLRYLVSGWAQRMTPGAFPLGTRERITFEYVLLAGVNDSVEDARRLAHELADLRCKVNLLPFNEHPGAAFKRPDATAIERFSAALRAAGVDTFVRTTRGRDIAAACGQLALDDAAADAADTVAP